MTRRRALTLVEMMLVIGTLSFFMVTVLPIGLGLQRQRKAMTGYLDDLQTASRVADRIGLEVRLASEGDVDTTIPGSPQTLVLRRPDGRLVFIALKGGRVVMTYAGISGALEGRSDLGRVAGLAFTRPSGEEPPTWIGYDVRLPRRAPKAPEAVLSSRVLVGGGDLR